MPPQKIALLTDSCADLTPRLVAENHIHVVPLRILCADGEYADGVNIRSEDIYTRLRSGELPQTSLPSGQDITDALDAIAAEGYDGVIAVMLSGGLSGTYNLMRLMAEDRQDLTIRVFDSVSGSLGMGLTLLQLAEDIRGGASWEELVGTRVPQLIASTFPFFSVDTLEYLQKGGRVGKAMIQVASMLKIKPMIQLYEGELQAAGIVRSRKKSLQRFIDDTKRFFKDKNINDYRICTGYGYDKEEFDALYAEVVEEMRQLGFQGEVEQYHIGCTIGVHTGPTPIGIAVIKQYDA